MILKNKVAIVTGASRGAGRGIALELALAGMHVYISGRSRRGHSTTEYEHNTLDDTVDIITSLGGNATAISCDHSKETDINNLVRTVLENESRIDILVNNVWAGYMGEHGGLKNTLDDFIEPFWKQPLWRWDNMMNVSPRAHFIISKLVAPVMIEQQSGLIVTTSFWDENKYLSNLAYDIVKQMKNRMMYGMAIELHPYNVAAIALGLGWIRTEHIHDLYDIEDHEYRQIDELLLTESTRYAGRAIVALASDDNIMAKTGKTLLTAELAQEYGFTDTDGTQPDVFVIPDESDGLTQR